MLDQISPMFRALSRRTVFRAAAIALGLAPLLLIEALLALFDVGSADRLADPFVGFAGVQPLFVLDEPGDRYSIAPNRQRHFFPDSFAAKKSPGEVRIFCLGGSTVAGHPYSSETSFTTFLELALQAADPKRQWEVVNCGGISYASYRLAPIVAELLAHQPDVFILLTGHNEFLEDRTYAHRKSVAWFVSGPIGGLLSLRTTGLMRNGLERLFAQDQTLQSNRTILPVEVDALLDYQGGLADYHRDDERRAVVIHHYRHNLERMTALAQSAGAVPILVNPPCNLRDCPPFKSEHRSGLTEARQREWEHLWDEARRQYRNDVYKAIGLLNAALAIDDQYAGLQYDLAKCYESLGKLPEARACYVRAKELDVCPLRILEPMSQAVLETSRRLRTLYLDAHGLFDEMSRSSISGDDWFVDHVHPSIEGHQALAAALVDTMSKAGLVTPRHGWQAERDRAWRTHVDRLPVAYYAHAEQRLETLRLWAQGRTGPPRKPNKARTAN